MKKQNILLFLTLLLVVLFIGASALYNYLGDKVQRESLVTENSTNSGTDEDAPDTQNSNTNGSTSGSTSSESSANDASESDSSDENTEKTPAPDFTVTDIDGTEYSLADFRGKPVILNFWASWCGPCKSEMPDFEEAYKEYGEQIHFMFVNLTDGYRETVETAFSYIKEQGYTFPVYYDTLLECTYAYNTTSIPATYFIDAEGNFVAWAQGAINSDILQQGIDMIYPSK